MRDYAKVGPKFWIGETGKALRGHPEAQIVATYLMTSPHANMIGLYYLPMMFLSHETGLTIEGASKGLRRCIEAGFCYHDPDSEVVWVQEMAAYQIGVDLSAQDKRCKGVQNEYDSIPANLFLSAFYDRYASHFHLTAKRESRPISASPLQAPSKPLRSQEQEQEQEQEKEQEQNSAQKPRKAARPKPDAVDPLAAFPDANPQVVKDWVAVRRDKRAQTLTQTAVDGIRDEAAKAGLSIEECLRICCMKHWIGFGADWQWRSAAQQLGVGPNRQEALERRNREVAERAYQEHVGHD